MTFPLAIGDFSSLKWAEYELSTIIGLIRGPLQGLSALHQAGCMHRDVQIRTILAISLDPPHAVLCDYGKAIYSASATDSGIGPIPTLAPEVDTDCIRYYTNKIDIWGIGYVCAWVLFRSFMESKLDRNRRPDKVWHQAIMTQLSQYAKKGVPRMQFRRLDHANAGMGSQS